MKRLILAIIGAATLAAGAVVARTPASTLDIYFIDVEGGQSTLIVTPAGESLLIDAGFPGDGTFSSKPDAAAQARDPQRIFRAARAAGVTQIDYLLTTHFHADHVGGVVELSQLMPIRTFIDHAAPGPDADAAVSGTQAIYDLYTAIRAKGQHLEPKPGDLLPLKGVEAIIVATAGTVLSKPLPGAGQVNSACKGTGVAASEKTENPRSTAVRLQYGKFRFLDVGDLTGAPLFALTCPANLIGESDAYLVAHHGGNDAADPAFYEAVKPTVTIINNGPKKGAQADTLAVIKRLGIDGWQLHRTLNDGAVNGLDSRIANLDESTSNWIKLSANASGTFTVTNARTGAVMEYRK